MGDLLQRSLGPCTRVLYIIRDSDFQADIRVDWISQRDYTIETKTKT